MVESNIPFFYFGYRGEDLKKFFSALLEDKKFNKIYEPFCGSAFFSLFAMQEELGKFYIISDSYQPIPATIDTLKKDPEALIAAYEKHRQNLAKLTSLQEKIDYFKKVQMQLNANYANSKQLDFIFVNNHSRMYVPILNGTDHVSEADDGYLTAIENTKLFRQRLERLSELLCNHKVEILHGAFQDILKNVAAGDFVYMDPPYPDLPSGATTIYHRHLLREDLHEQLIAQIQRLNIRKVSFVLSYGSYEVDKKFILNTEDLKLHHYVRLGKSSNGLFNEYLEHIYISQDLISGANNRFEHLSVIEYASIKDKSISDVITTIKLQHIESTKDKKISVKMGDKEVVISPREYEVIQYLIIGYSAKSTAQALGISPRTVELHLENVKKKTNCRSKIELISKVKLN